LQPFSQISKLGPKPKTIGGLTYFDLGRVNSKLTYMVQTEMGSGGVGASGQTVAKVIDSLLPRNVIMVGIAFGMRKDKQKIGGVLVSGN
jgi:nucleoside phosphorylase